MPARSFFTSAISSSLESRSRSVSISNVYSESGREEVPKYFRGLLGNLFREEVAGLDSLTSDIITPFLPQADRSGLSPVPGSQRSLGTPQNEQGARYPA